MPRPIRHQPAHEEQRPPSGGALHPDVLRLIEALAEAAAARDYDARFRPTPQG